MSSTTEGMPMSADLVTVATARAHFEFTLSAKSPRTAANYRSALNRFTEFLRERLGPADAVACDALPAAILEEFYTWLLSVHGRQHRTTAMTYVAGARAFMRFLDRRRLLAPDLSYE